MTENDIGKGLLNLNTDAPRSAADERQLARKVLQRDRRRVWLLAAMAVLLWLVAAASVFFVVYVAIFHLYPKQHQLMRDYALGDLPVQQMIEIQSLHFRTVEICTLVVSAAFVAATLAAVCTVLLVLVSRQATMRQINAGLAEIFEELHEQRPGPAREKT
jgi:cell division protein FtsL